MAKKAKKINLKDAKCTSLELIAPVLLAKENGDGNGDNKGNGFRIEAYTGEVVDRWFGKLVISINGMQANNSLPILRDHNSSQIVGYSQKAWTDGSFFVEGMFSDVTEVSKEVKGLADEGFPWQASIGVKPSMILSLEEESSMEVNGETINGPAEIWLESRVHEVSFVPLGADDNTNVSRFSKFEEIAPNKGNVPTGAEHKQNKGDDMEITLALLEKDAPELLKQIREAAKAEGLSEGTKQGAIDELARIKNVSEQLMPGHDDLLTKLMYDGKTTGPEAAVKVLAAEKALKQTALENLESGSVKPVHNSTPPETEELDDDSGDDGEFDKDKATAKFNKTKALKEEFGDVDTYLAYCEALAEGQVRTLKK